MQSRKKKVNCLECGEPVGVRKDLVWGRGGARVGVHRGECFKAYTLKIAQKFQVEQKEAPHASW